MRDFQAGGRSAAYAEHAMAATSHPLATQTALDILRAGGNAVDAAVAACAVQGIAEPHMTGIGGDCFVLYAPASGGIHALNGSGCAPSGVTAGKLRNLGLAEIDAQSAHAVTVPGAIDAWCQLVEKHGKLSMDQILAPAIKLAREGCLVTPRVANDWADLEQYLAADANAAEILLPGGKAPAAGTKYAQPKLAKTLEAIAASGRSAFYEGAIAQDMVKCLNDLGGFHTMEDFANQRAEWVEPISTGYKGYEVFECPPNGQGIVALMMLNILSGFDLSDSSLSDADRAHLLAEVTRIGYTQRDAYVSDPRKSDVPVDALLSEQHSSELRALISMEKAGDFAMPNLPEHKDTVYLCVVDDEGNAISFINSIFTGFGSGHMAKESGVLLHSRGSSFELKENHPNCIAPGKRPMHTIIPGMLMKNGQAVMPFGVMGGHYQATGQVNFITRFINQGMDPQEALQAPRSFKFEGTLEVETSYSREVFDSLKQRGHQIVWADSPMGGGQAIHIDRERGILIGGSDPRKDGFALGY